MVTVETRFRDRVVEVEHYFKMLVAVESALTARKTLWKDGRKRLPKVLGDELTLKMLKATSFLLLYNLIEATVRDSVESIWGAVGESGAKAPDLLPSLQEVWVGAEFRKKDAFSAAASNYREIALEILKSVSLGKVPAIVFKRVMTGGNINNVAIREMCETHGVNFVAPRNTRDGVDLDTVKRRRNILAHGEQTFEEIGSSHAVADLREIKMRSVAYLRHYVRRVDRYIERDAFKVA